MDNLRDWLLVLLHFHHEAHPDNNKVDVCQYESRMWVFDNLMYSVMRNYYKYIKELKEERAASVLDLVKEMASSTYPALFHQIPSADPAESGIALSLTEEGESRALRLVTPLSNEERFASWVLVRLENRKILKPL